MTEDVLKEIEELARKATPAPWYWDYAGPGHLLLQVPPVQGIRGNDIKCVLDGCTDDGNDLNISGDKADRDLIVSLVNNREALLKAIESAAEWLKVEDKFTAFIAELDKEGWHPGITDDGWDALEAARDRFRAALEDLGVKP
jgi:hypothetical protein